MTREINEKALRPLLIICDTCIFVSDFRLSNEFWKKIGAILNTHQNAKLVLPKAIEIEVKRKLFDLGSESIEKLKSTNLQASSRLVSIDLDIEALTKKLDKEVQDYLKFIKKFATGKILTTAFPKANVEHYFERAVHGLKPYASANVKDGYRKAANGFRDAVIWESVKEIYAKNITASVVFISTNNNDFSEKSDVKKLHKDFQVDIDLFGQKDRSFSYVSDENGLAEFLKEVKLSKKFCRDIEEKLIEFIDNHSENFQEALTQEDEELGHNETHYLEYTIKSVKIEHIYEESDDSILVEAVLETDIYREIYMDKSTYYASHDDDGFKLVDADWNEHVMIVGYEETQSIHVLSVVPTEANHKSASVFISELTINGVQIDA